VRCSGNHDEEEKNRPHNPQPPQPTASIRGKTAFTLHVADLPVRVYCGTLAQARPSSGRAGLVVNGRCVGLAATIPPVLAVNHREAPTYKTHHTAQNGTHRDKYDETKDAVAGAKPQTDNEDYDQDEILWCQPLHSGRDLTQASVRLAWSVRRGRCQVGGCPRVARDSPGVCAERWPSRNLVASGCVDGTWLLMHRGGHCLGTRG
jgi:hypothetical protein